MLKLKQRLRNWRHKVAGTKAGGLKAAQSNKKKYGKDYYTNLGKRGGSAAHPMGRGFQLSDKAAEAGRKGGKISKRGKAKKEVE